MWYGYNCVEDDPDPSDDVSGGTELRIGELGWSREPHEVIHPEPNMTQFDGVGTEMLNALGAAASCTVG